MLLTVLDVQSPFSNRQFHHIYILRYVSAYYVKPYSDWLVVVPGHTQTTLDHRDIPVIFCLFVCLLLLLLLFFFFFCFFLFFFFFFGGGGLFGRAIEQESQHLCSFLSFTSGINMYDAEFSADVGCSSCVSISEMAVVVQIYKVTVFSSGSFCQVIGSLMRL